MKPDMACPPSQAASSNTPSTIGGASTRAATASAGAPSELPSPLPEACCAASATGPSTTKNATVAARAYPCLAAKNERRAGPQAQETGESEERGISSPGLQGDERMVAGTREVCDRPRCSLIPSSRLTIAAVFPLASPTSASLSAVIICSGMCRPLPMLTSL